MTKLRPCGALFDMDGVLVDSNPLHLRAWRELTQRHGIHLSDTELQYGLGGRLSQDIVRHFFGPVADPEADALTVEKENIFRSLAASGLPSPEGLHALLNDLHGCGFCCAVATSAPRENLELALRQLSLASFFNAVVTAEDVSRGKPDPQVYLLAAQRIGIAPRQCVVFEDAVAGIEAGRRAGCICFGLTTTRSADELLAAGARLAVADFTTLSAEKIRSEIDC